MTEFGTLVGIVVLIAIAIGLIRSLSNKDYTWRQKLFGFGKNSPRPKRRPSDDEPW